MAGPSHEGMPEKTHVSKDAFGSGGTAFAALLATAEFSLSGHQEGREDFLNEEDKEEADGGKQVGCGVVLNADILCIPSGVWQQMHEACIAFTGVRNGCTRIPGKEMPSMPNKRQPPQGSKCMKPAM